MRLSVLIPSRNERFLTQTIDDVFAKATGEVEVIAVLDGYWPDPPIEDHVNLTLLHRTDPQGMRDGINSAASIARGKWILKADAHCMFSQGFDEVLCTQTEDNWVVVPRRYALDAHAWKPKPQNDRPAVDYHYLSYPFAKLDEIGMHGQPWRERAKQRVDIPIDEEMSSQGSCWFMSKRYWKNHFGGALQEEGYGRFVQEAQELGLKAWLGGGAMMVNKNCWYAHLHKGKEMGRGYFIDKREMIRGAKYSADFWLNNRWDKRVHDFEWLIDKFWPVPTWPTNWKELHYGNAGQAAPMV